VTLQASASHRRSPHLHRLALRLSVIKRAMLKMRKIPKLKKFFRVSDSKTPFPKFALRKKVTKRATPPV
jgi:hypothetical protein